MNDEKHEDDELLTAKEVRAVIKCGTTKLYELVNSGHLRIVKIGRASRFTRSSVRNIVENGAPQATAKVASSSEKQPAG